MNDGLMPIGFINGLHLYVERKEDEIRNREFPNGEHGVVVHVVTAPRTHVTNGDLHLWGISLEDIKNSFENRRQAVVKHFCPGSTLVTPKDSYRTDDGYFVMSWLVRRN